MRIVCRQTILMEYHALFLRKSGKISQNLSSAVVVIGALRVNYNTGVSNTNTRAQALLVVEESLSY